MKLAEIPRLFSPTVWLVALGGLIVCGAILWWMVVSGPAHDRAAAATSRSELIVAQGATAAAGDAVAIVVDQAGRETRIDQQTQENHDAIIHAPGAAVAVDPGVDSAGRRAICLRDVYRCQPACVRLLGSCPR